MSTPEGKGNGMVADASFEMQDGGVETMVGLGELQEGVEFDDEAEVEYMAPTAYSESDFFLLSPSAYQSSSMKRSC